MQKIRKLTALGMAVLLCIALAACGGAEGAVKEGDAYRDFTASLAGGGELTLSDNKGKVILLNFWATWCGPCVGEMPAFPRLVEKYGDDLALIAVDCGEDEATVKNFLETNGYTFPVVLDLEGKVSALYPADGLPYTLLIDRDGKIVSIHEGAGSADDMFELYSNEIDRLL